MNGIYSFADVIKEIVELKGIEVLKNDRLFMAMFSDLAPNMPLENKIIKRICSENSLSRFYIIVVCGMPERNNIINTVNVFLKEELGFSDVWARKVVLAFCDALSISYNYPENDRGIKKIDIVPVKTLDSSERKGFSVSTVASVDASKVATLNSSITLPSDSDKVFPDDDYLMTVKKNEEKIINFVKKQASSNFTIWIEESEEEVSKVEKVIGMQFESGYADTPFYSSYYAWNQKKKANILENVRILMTTTTIAYKSQIEPILDSILPGESLLIFADNVKGKALSMINARMGNSFACLSGLILNSKYTYIGQREELLTDIAVVTGGRFVQLGMNPLKYLRLKGDILGYAKKVVIEEHRTTIIGGGGLMKSIEKQKDYIQKSINEYPSRKGVMDELAYNGQFMRINQLGGVILIKAGGRTIQEMKAAKIRLEDQINKI